MMGIGLGEVAGQESFLDLVSQSFVRPVKLELTSPVWHEAFWAEPHHDHQ
jgi:hypothetical protein